MILFATKHKKYHLLYTPVNQCITKIFKLIMILWDFSFKKTIKQPATLPIFFTSSIRTWLLHPLLNFPTCETWILSPLEKVIFTKIYFWLSISCKDKKYDFRLFQVDSVQKIIGEKGKSFLLRRKKCIFATKSPLKKWQNRTKSPLKNVQGFKKSPLKNVRSIKNNTS